jgi:hypothetical protein
MSTFENNRQELRQSSLQHLLSQVDQALNCTSNEQHLLNVVNNALADEKGKKKEIISKSNDTLNEEQFSLASLEYLKKYGLDRNQ